MSQRSIICYCPFHEDSTTPNLHIYEDRGAHCFACGWNGTVVDVMAAKGYSSVELLTRQDEFLRSCSDGLPPFEGHKRTLNGITRPEHGWSLYEDDASLFAYLTEKRKMLPATIKTFNTRSYNGIIFGWPWRDKKWATRWWDGTYLYDPGFSRETPYYVGGLPPAGAPVVLVEGILDAMRVFQSDPGVAVLATLGGPTKAQSALLTRYKVYEMLDNDAGGDAHRNLLRKNGVECIKVSYETPDPADAYDWEVKDAITKARGGGL